MQAKGAAKDVGKNINPGSNNLPDPSAAADKASGAIKGLASGAGKGTKNVSLDLSDLPNPFDGAGTGAGSIADKVCVTFYVLSCRHPWYQSLSAGPVQESCSGFHSLMGLAPMVLLPGTTKLYLCDMSNIS